MKLNTVGKNTSMLAHGMLSAFIEWAFGFTATPGKWIFRGQPDAKDGLIPRIARDDPKVDPLHVERDLLNELKLRLPSVYSGHFGSDWELLAFVQHHGAPTRLLDWTRSALNALWFAVVEHKRDDDRPDCAIWACQSREADYVGEEQIASNHPLEITKTRLYQPKYFDRRLAAQQGLFSVHRYWEAGSRVVPLEKNKNFSSRIRKLVVPSRFRFSLLKELDSVGINAASLFPDIDGLCTHLSVTHNLSPRMAILSGDVRVAMRVNK